MSFHCLNMKAAFGFNKDLVGGVHSLFDETREAILFPSSHTLVYHDCRNGSQQFLQGHSNVISAVCVSNDKKWIVSADFGGRDTMIIVWDARTLLPVRTIVDQIPGGVIRIDLSDDSALLAVLSGAVAGTGAGAGTSANTSTSAGAKPAQHVYLFEWSSPEETPIVSAPVPPGLGFQRDIRFNPADYRELVTNSAVRTVFWAWEEQLVEKDLVNTLTHYSPDILLGEFKSLPSAFTVSCFLPGTTAALTGTVSGEIVLFDVSGRAPAATAGAPQRRIPVKLLTLHAASGNVQTVVGTDEISEKDEGVVLEAYQATGDFGASPYLVPGPQYFQASMAGNRVLQQQAFFRYLTACLSATGTMTSAPTSSFAQAITFIHGKTDGYVITGGLDGAVRMFDFRLRLLAWYENIDAGPVTSVSIAMPQLNAGAGAFPGGDADISVSAVALMPGNTPREYTSKSEALHARFGSVVLRDFVVGTARAAIVLMPAAVFEFVEPEKRRGTLLYQGVPHTVSAVYTPRDTRDLPIKLNYNLKTSSSSPLSWVATRRGDVLLFDFTSNKILRSANLVGSIAATDAAGRRITGTLAQRHAEGFEQLSFLLPEHPLAPIRTQSYSHVTTLSLHCPSNGSRPILLAGTNVGSCLLMDPFTLQVLSAFRHLSRTKTVSLRCEFLKRRTVTLPAEILAAKFSREGDVIAVVDETSYLTILSKTAVEERSRDLTTGKTIQASDEDAAFNYGNYSDIYLTSLVTPLQTPPIFITDQDEARRAQGHEDGAAERRTASGVRLHPAALLARVSQRKRQDASTTGQWQSLGRLVVTNSAILRAVIFCDFLPSRIEEGGRDPLVLLSKDRFFTIVDMDRTIAATDTIVVYRRFAAEQSATPTAMCFLPRPPYYADTLSDAERAQEAARLAAERDPLTRRLREALFSLQAEDAGPLCAKYRPDLQPVDQRSLLLLANSHYKFKLREVESLPGALELNNRTVFPTALLTTNPSQVAYFTGGYTPQGQLPTAAILQGPNYCVNPSLAGPYPLRRTVLAPTYGLPVCMLRPIAAYMSDPQHDLSSCTALGGGSSSGGDGGASSAEATPDGRADGRTGERADGRADPSPALEPRYRYRTRYETLNSAGGVRHVTSYVAFATPRKVIGLMRTPFDGASHRYMGMIAHAGDILALDACYCFCPGLDAGNTFLVSAGTSDFALFLWGVDYPTLDLMVDSAVTSGGDFASFDPFVAQLEGGSTGQYYTEIQDYFSYAQIADSEEKGVSPNEKARAPVSMVDEILRALGVFISNGAIADIVGEITDEEVRLRRLRFFVGRVRAALHEGRDPVVVEATAFGYNPVEDAVGQEQRIMTEMSLFEQSESTLWEVVGESSATLGLQDFIRILVNHRPVLPYRLEDIVRAFTVFGADEKVGILDKASLVNTLVGSGEQFSAGELMDCLNILAGSAPGTDPGVGASAMLPDQVSVTEFSSRILGFEELSDGRDERGEDSLEAVG